MDAATIISLGALLVAAGSAWVGNKRDRRAGDQGDRSLTVAEDDLQLRTVVAANEALTRRVAALESRIDMAEKKVAACEERDLKHVRQRDSLWQFIIRAGLTPPPELSS